MKQTALMALLAIATMATGQIIGVNGAGFFENRTDQSDAWLHEATDGHPWALRIPGGAIAKFADPVNGSGWGMTYAGIDTLQPLYGSPDEEAQENALQKWRRKADAQPMYSYLDELLGFLLEFPNCQVIWTANIYIPVDRALYPITYLLAAGVDVKVVELGNESYSQVDHDFQKFMELSAPLRQELDGMHIPYAFPAAPMGTRARPDHNTWNGYLEPETNGHYVIYHRYYDGREWDGAVRPVDTAATAAQILAWDFAGEFDEMKAAFPNAAGYMVTEYNTQPAALLGNTSLNALFFEQALPAGRDAFDYFCVHNGVSPDVYGIIYGNPPQKNTTFEPWAAAVQSVAGQDPDTGTGGCDTIYTVTYDTTITLVGYQQDSVLLDKVCLKCGRFWYLVFHMKYCGSCSAYEVIQMPVYDTTTTIITDVKYVNCDTTGQDESRCVNPGGTDPDLIQCRTGQNDDYLHPERYLDAEGNCICDECGVEWDHRINTKFWDRIVPHVYEQTGVLVSPDDHVDAYVTLRETGQVIYRPDIFHWCDPTTGKPTVFNMNKEVWNEWHNYLHGYSTYTFGIELIHRETGLNIALYWEDHDTVTLSLTGL